MLYKIYFILIVFNYIIKAKETNDPYEYNNFSNSDATLQIFNKDKIIDKLYINLTNISKPYLSDVKFSYTGKIFYLDSFSKIELLKDNFLNYRIKWIFMFDSIKELSNFTKNLKRNNIKYFTSVIIIPKDLYEENYYKEFEYLAYLRIYIFYMNNDMFKYIIDHYDYRIVNENIYARLFSLNNKEFNLIHLYCIIYSCIILLGFCINLFRYSLNLDQRNFTFFFIRTVYFFPIIKVCITLLFIMKLNFLTKHNDLYSIGKSPVITFVINSLDILFKSLLITFSILASNGIDAILRISSREDFFKFTKKFVSIYFIFSTAIINQKYNRILPKFYIFISLGVETFVFYLINKNYKKSKEKVLKELELAILYCNEYINSIQIKKNMIIWHLRIYFFYYISFILINCYLYITINLDIEKEIYFHFIEVLLTFSYCLIYRPRLWPENFDLYFKNGFQYFGNIYTYKINSNVNNNIETKNYNEQNNNINFEPNYSDNENEKLNINETNRLMNKKIQINDMSLKNYYINNQDFPIVVIGPKFNYNLSKNRKNKFDIFSDLIKSSEIGYNIK